MTYTSTFSHGRENDIIHDTNVNPVAIVVIQLILLAIVGIEHPVYSSSSESILKKEHRLSLVE